MQSTNVLSAQRVIASLIEAGRIESTNYMPGPPPFSSVGTVLDLVSGAIETPNFAVDAAGNAEFRGDVTAESLTAICQDGGNNIIVDTVTIPGVSPTASGLSRQAPNGNVGMVAFDPNNSTASLAVQSTLNGARSVVYALADPDPLSGFAQTWLLCESPSGNHHASFSMGASDGQRSVAVTVTDVGGNPRGFGLSGSPLVQWSASVDVFRVIAADDIVLDADTLTMRGQPMFPAGANNQGVTPAAGWNVTVTYARVIAGGLLTLRLSITRTGAAITAGNADIALGTLGHQSGNVNVAQGLVVADTSIGATNVTPLVTLNPSTMALTLSRYPDIATNQQIFVTGTVLWRNN